MGWGRGMLLETLAETLAAAATPGKAGRVHLDINSIDAKVSNGIGSILVITK